MGAQFTPWPDRGADRSRTERSRPSAAPRRGARRLAPVSVRALPAARCEGHRSQPNTRFNEEEFALDHVRRRTVQPRPSPGSSPAPRSRAARDLDRTSAEDRRRTRALTRAVRQPPQARLAGSNLNQAVKRSRTRAPRHLS
ncbi:hypothetical protein ACRAWF_09530 [Streptomyces sp. L7]